MVSDVSANRSFVMMAYMPKREKTIINPVNIVNNLCLRDSEFISRQPLKCIRHRMSMDELNGVLY